MTRGCVECPQSLYLTPAEWHLLADSIMLEPLERDTGSAELRTLTTCHVSGGDPVPSTARGDILTRRGSVRPFVAPASRSDVWLSDNDMLY